MNDEKCELGCMWVGGGKQAHRLTQPWLGTDAITDQ